MEGMEIAESIQREQLERIRDFLGPDVSTNTAEVGKTVAKREAPIAFSNPRAKEFFVDGTKIPDGICPGGLSRENWGTDVFGLLCAVPFDAGPSWSGLMPISGAKNETRKLFFWYSHWLGFGISELS